MSSDSRPSTPQSGQKKTDYDMAYNAFFNPEKHKFETIDFRLPATRVNRDSFFPKTENQARRRHFYAMLLGILVGILFAFIGFGVDQLNRGLTIGLYSVAAVFMDQGLFWPGAVLFVVFCLVFVTIAACLVVYVAPLGAGSGIPELKSYLNGVRIPQFLAIQSLFVKAVGICFSLSSGLICGKQGPMIHAGAITGAGLSQMASTRFRWRWNTKKFRFLRTEAWKRDFTAVGAAVGVAVAFGSPMGAWMWVYEEACTHWTWDLGIVTLAGCLSGAMVVRVLNFLASNSLQNVGFGAFTLTMFGKLVTPFQGNVFPLKDIPAFILLGLIGGIAGAVLPLVNKRITLFRYDHLTRKGPRIMEAIGIAFLTATVRLILPLLAKDCRPVDDELTRVLESAPLSDFSRFVCENENEYSPWAAMIYNPTDTVVRGLLYTQGNIFPAGAVAAALVYYYIFIVWTYGIAVPAGVFFPGFLLGSVYGRLLGIAVQAMFPGRVGDDAVSLTGYALVGAISALAGLTRTISVAVVALEATGANNASFAGVFVALIAKLVGDMLYRQGIYDLHIGLKDIPFIAARVPDVDKYSRIRVTDVMKDKLIAVRRLQRISGLLELLEQNSHNVFPVFLKVTGKEPTFEGEEAKVMDSGGSSRSDTDLMEKELEILERNNPDNVHTSPVIITPAHRGMQATIYDEGGTQIVQFSERQDGQLLKEYTRRSRVGSNFDEEVEPRFELLGTITRRVLLALVNHECNMADGDSNRKLEREDFDAAWPNSIRVKSQQEETKLLKRARDLGITDKILDLQMFTDVNPLLMTDRGLVRTAYKLLRSTGGRHILIINMRNGGIICGILSRQDVLPKWVDKRSKEKNESKTRLEQVILR